MFYKKGFIYMLSILSIILIVIWCIAYRFTPTTLPYDNLIHIVSMSSSFTNIAYMLSIYTLFFLYLVAFRIPCFDEMYCVRSTRKQYLVTGMKTVVSSAFIFAIMLSLIQMICVRIQFIEAVHLMKNGYLIGVILNILLWTCSYMVLGTLFYLIYLISYSKLIGIGMVFMITMILLIAFRFHHSRVLFAEIDVISELWYGELHLLLYVCIIIKYIVISWLIYNLCEAVLKKRDILIAKNRRDQYERN